MQREAPSVEQAGRWSAFRSSRWGILLWLGPAILAIGLIVVLIARWLVVQPEVVSFMTTYPGTSALPAGAPVGFPAWLQWQHFLNAFFMLFIIRTGWQIRSAQRPPAFWTRKNTGLITTKNPPVRLSIFSWLHLTLDALWVLNGAVFYVLLFVTGQWMRVVPTRWDIFPNAVTAGLRYASLNWPTENGWVNYNSLQTISYFAITFVVAPLALLTGIRMAPGLAARLRPLDKIVPLRATRLVHFSVMLVFMAFIVVHVTLVLATGTLRNLNHIYAGRNDQSWWGFGIFTASILFMVVAWIALRPSVLAAIAGKTGTIRR